MNKKKKLQLIILMIIVIAITSIIIIEPKIFLSSMFKKDTLTIQQIDASINEIYIYGNHLNIIGDITLDQPKEIKNLTITLYDGNELNYQTNFKQNETNIEFKLSDTKNNGLPLDHIKKGDYSILLKLIDNEDNIFYYPLSNKTKYNKTEYYTITTIDKTNHILITNNNDNKTMNMEIKEINKNDIYDIAIDAGHGGKDPGACANSHCETDFTLTLAQKLKHSLEQAGLKVKLTREDNLNENTLLPTYGSNGRVTIAGNVKAKYLFSFHLNSGIKSDTGFEIYTTNNIDYTFAKSLVENITKTINIKPSNNKKYKVFDGIYTRTFLQQEINEMLNDAKENNYQPYPITTNTTYYYIIRETGGYITGAYTDGRNKNKDLNPYYQSNVGVETYLFELGYITNLTNLNDIKNNMDKYIEGIAKAIIDKLCV